MIRDKGLRGLWFSILGELGYRRLSVREIRLDRDLHAVHARIPLSFEQLTAAGIGEYNEFRGTPGSTTAEERLRAGHSCFIARHRGRIAGLRWAATGQAWSEYLRQEIPLAGDEVFLYDAFTSPDVRGQRIFPALTHEIHRHFSTGGRRRALCHTLPENRAAMKADTGYERIGTVGYVGAGPLRRRFDTSKRR